MGIPEPQTMTTDLERFTQSTVRRLLEILTDLNEPGFAFVKLEAAGERLSLLVAGLASCLNQAEIKRSSEYTIVPKHHMLGNGHIPLWRPVGAFPVLTPRAPKQQPIGPKWWKILHDAPTPKEKRIGDPILWAEADEKRKPDLMTLYPSMIHALRGHDAPLLSKTHPLRGHDEPLPPVAPPLQEGAAIVRQHTTIMANYLKEKYGADIIYGDTDSVMVVFPNAPEDLVECMKLGGELAKEITKVINRPPAPPVAPPAAPTPLKKRTYQGFVHYISKKYPIPAWKKNFARYVSGYWRGPVGMLWRANELPDYTAGETDAEYEVDGGKKNPLTPAPLNHTLPIQIPSPFIPPHPIITLPPPPPPIRPIPYPFNETLRYADPITDPDSLYPGLQPAHRPTQRVKMDENDLPYVMPPMPDPRNWGDKSLKEIMESEQYSRYIQLHDVSPRLAYKQFRASWECSKPYRLARAPRVSSVLRVMKRIQGHPDYLTKMDLGSVMITLITSRRPVALTANSASDILETVLQDHSSPREIRRFLCSLNFAQAMLSNRNTPQYSTYQIFLRGMIGELGWHVMAHVNLGDHVISHIKRLDRTPISPLWISEITITDYVFNPSKWVPNSDNILRWMYGRLQYDRLKLKRSMLRMLIGLRPTAGDAKDIQSLFYAAILAVLTDQVDLPVDGADPVVLTEPAGDITLVTDQPVVTPTEPENDDNTVMINDQTTENPVLDPVPTPASVVEAPDSSDWETDFTGCPAR